MVQPSPTANDLADRFSRYGKLADVTWSTLRQIPMSRRSLEANDYIVREADEQATCAVLVSGFAYRQKITGQGARQIIAICLPGEVVDLGSLHLPVADHSIQMLTAGEILTFPRSSLQRATEQHPELARAIMIDTSLDISIMREWITNIGQRSAKGRVAHLLCELATRRSPSAGHDGMFYEIPMNQEQMGDMLGLTSTHINRMIRELIRDGLVSWSRQSVHLPAWQKLRSLADFNSRYLHLGQLVST